VLAEWTAVQNGSILKAAMAKGFLVLPDLKHGSCSGSFSSYQIRFHSMEEEWELCALRMMY
jgi:hypothetical protein